MSIRIVEAQGIEGVLLYTVRTHASGNRSLRTTGHSSQPNKTYWYVVQEKVREYPFGTYTDMHYTAFTKREDAEEYAGWHKDQ